MAKVAVDIWSDVMCPWCAVGYTQFAKAVDSSRDELEVEVRWMPFELNPDLPPEGKDQASTSPKSTAARPTKSPRCARRCRRPPRAPASDGLSPARARNRRR
jgi:predicted DsbA family dithiol-disulfide isomerase